MLPSVRYCITLDSDTRLPRDAAKRLIGIIAHPLNQPRFDRDSGRVTEGYGILQPRVSVTMASAAGSLFARTYAGHTGVDPYTTAVSDVYQDLFGEGIFTGKGLYDVDAFAAALEDRVPENALLSHDLFEGLYARTALVTDIEVVDDYPVERARARAPAAPLGARRLADPVVAVSVRAVAHRRGAQSPAAHRALEDPRQPPAQPAAAGDAASLLVLGWTVLPGHPLVWTGGRPGGAGAFPASSRALDMLRGPRRGQSWGVFLRTAADDLKTGRRALRAPAHLHGQRGQRAAARDRRSRWSVSASRAAACSSGRRRRPAPPAAGRCSCARSSTA